jgi:hypothetical protein
MKKLDRRQFLKNSAASLAFARPGVNAQAETKKLFDSGQSLSFDGNNYRWEWSAQNDRFRVLDLQARIIGLRSAAGFTKKGLRSSGHWSRLVVPAVTQLESQSAATFPIQQSAQLWHCYRARRSLKQKGAAFFRYKPHNELRRTTYNRASLQLWLRKIHRATTISFDDSKI